MSKFIVQISFFTHEDHHSFKLCHLKIEDSFIQLLNKNVNRESLDIESNTFHFHRELVGTLVWDHHDLTAINLNFKLLID